MGRDWVGYFYRCDYLRQNHFDNFKLISPKIYWKSLQLCITAVEDIGEDASGNKSDSYLYDMETIHLCSLLKKDGIPVSYLSLVLQCVIRVKSKSTPREGRTAELT